MTKNILCFTNFFSLFPVRAAEAVAKEFIVSLLDRDYSVTILVPNFDLDEKKELEKFTTEYKGRIRVYSISSLKKDFIEEHIFIRFLLAVIWYIPLCLKGLSIDKIDYVISLYHPTHFAALAGHINARAKRIPHIIWVRDLFPISSATKQSIFRSLPYLTIHRMVSPTLRKAGISLYISEEIRRIAVDRYSIKEKTAVLPNLIDTSKRLLTIPEGIKIKKEPSKISVAFVGEIFPARMATLLILLKAIKELIDQRYNLQLLLIGHGYGMPEFEKHVKDLGLIKYVTVTGKVPNSFIPHYLQKTDIGIGMLNASNEVIGSVTLKMLEYMVAGLPIIAAKGSVSPDAVIDGFNGLIIAPDDVASLVLALRSLIDDKQMRERLGRNSKDFVEKNYSINAVTNRFETILDEINVSTS